MEENYQFRTWLIHNWSRAGLPAAVVLLLFSPLFIHYWGLPVFLIYLQLPLYMIHQYEEHARGAFKTYANKLVGNGREVFTDRGIMILNLLLVWLGITLLVYFSIYWKLSAGMIALYLAFLNGLGHVILGFVRGGYNPGYWTSLLLFIPLAGFSLLFLTLFHGMSLPDHLVGALGAFTLHLPILAYVLVRRSQVPEE